ncbi:hypothetical protein [Nonomuraea ceibae]|uniref:hypothetical protein n=1 Tax=Nonomuraea ceibae TaxID=1935170 RepID=UPI001C5F8CA1|nr:hypothetical protein [Nonomuraea ceibae]
MPGRTDLPKEIQLIRERRGRAVPRMSHKRAAEMAEQLGGGSFSASTWGKIESGEYDAPIDRIVIMAMVVGATADEMEERGRPDVAVLLREELRRRVEAEPALADVRETPEAIQQLVIRGLDELRAIPGLTKEQRQVLERNLVASVKQNIATQIDQIRTALSRSQDASARQ